MIGKDKIRTTLTLTKELKSELEKIAKEDGRTFNNLIIKILTDYIKAQK